MAGADPPIFVAEPLAYLVNLPYFTPNQLRLGPTIRSQLWILHHSPDWIAQPGVLYL
jgi:hypothetical protein